MISILQKLEDGLPITTPVGGVVGILRTVFITYLVGAVAIPLGILFIALYSMLVLFVIFPAILVYMVFSGVKKMLRFFLCEHSDTY